MFKTRWFAMPSGLLGAALIGGSTLSGCSDQTETGTQVERPAAADAGEKASREHMKAMMGKGGKTKTKPAAASKG